MTTETVNKPTVGAEVVARSVDEHRPGWSQRLRSADHKQIGITMICASLAALVLAGTESILMQIQLFVPDNSFLSPEQFNRLLTLHDTSFLLLFALPLMMGLMTYATPLMIGARSTAFPRLSSFASWLIVGAGALLYAGLFFNVPAIGAEMPAPLSNVWFSAGSGIDIWAISAAFVALALTCNAVDLAATVTTMRAPGMTPERTPIFAWTTAIFSYTSLVTAPVLLAATLMLLIERQTETIAFFDPVRGGSPMLWQHLYWWFAHAAPYMVAIAAIGVVTEVLQTFSGRRLANRTAVIASIVAIATLAVLGWGQQLVGAPIDGAWTVAYAIIGLAMIVPVTVLLYSWVATIWNGSLRFTPPMLFAFGFAVMFALAAFGSFMLAVPGIAQLLLGSQFSSAQQAALLAGSALFGGFAGLYYWAPKMSGRMYKTGPAKTAFFLILIGSLISVLSTASLGLDGMPQQIYTYGSESGWQVRSVEAALGILLVSLGVFVALVNLIRSVGNGAVAGNDPWNAATLEWFTPAPPPVNNFDVVPTIDSDRPLLSIREQIGSSAPLAGTVATPPNGHVE